MLPRQVSRVLAGLLISASLCNYAYAADYLTTGMSMARMKEFVTGKSRRDSYSIMLLMPLAGEDRCASDDPKSRCTEADKAAKEVFFDLQGKCQYEIGKEAKYCAQIAENAELDLDYKAAALFRQHACNIGDGKSCKLAEKDLDKYLSAEKTKSATATATASAASPAAASASAASPAVATANGGAQPLASDVARLDLVKAVTGKRSDPPMDVSKIIPRRETKVALDCESKADYGCTSRDKDRLKFFMELRGQCIYGVEEFDHVNTKDRPKYCGMIAMLAEDDGDFESAAIFLQRACDLGQGKSCKKAMKDVETARPGH